MKKIILFAATILTFSVIGCKSGGGDPKSVLMSFFDALGHKDVAAAKKYATKESESMLQMVEMGMKMAPDSAKDKQYDKSNMEFGDATISGDKATIPVKDKKSGETTTYTLKKEGSEWKVAFDKATMTQMGADKMKNSTNDMKTDMNDLGDSLKNKMEDLKTEMDTTTH